MSRSRIDISYTCGKGAAKSKLEQYLTQQGFKRLSGKGVTIWSQDLDKAVCKHIYPEYGDGEITLYAFLSMARGKKKYVEEDLRGLNRFFSKRGLNKVVKGAKKLYETDKK